jgi:4-amino-4-deoxy-L-arabinose transferase-like glycosyltransferase
MMPLAMRALSIQNRLIGTPAAVRLRTAWTVDGVVQVVAQAMAAAFIVGFVVAAVFRLSYPFALQLTEPSTLTEVERILHGQALYVPPTLDYTPMIYGPVYFYLSAAMAAAIGDGYAPMRLVSLLASIGTMLVIGRLVQRETNNLGAALVAGGLYAATFPFSETGLDLGRVDALFTFFLFAAVYAARRATFEPTQVGRSLALSGWLLGMAGITKLPLGALPVGLAILVYAAFVYRFRAVVFVLVALATIGATVLVLRGISGPWPTWYMWDLPRFHELRPNLIGRFWFADLLPRFFVCLLIGPVFVIARLLQRDPRPLVFYAMIAGSLLALSWVSRSNAGGAMNVLLPAFGIAAVLLGIGLHAAVKEISGTSGRARAFRAYVFGLCVLQFSLLAYNPRITVPYRSDQWADERLAATLAALPGPIFASDLDGYMHGSVDNSVHPMFGPIGELQGAYGGPFTFEGRQLAATVRQGLVAHAYPYVVVYDRVCCLNDDLAAAGYVDMGPLFPPGDVFYAWKSWRTPEPELFAAPAQP